MRRRSPPGQVALAVQQIAATGARGHRDTPPRMGEEREVRSRGVTSAGPQPAGGGGMAVGKQTRVDGIRQPAGGAGPGDSAPSAGAARLIHLLITTRQRPDEQTDDVYAFLSSLELGELLETIQGAAERGLMGLLMARSNAAAWYGRAQILTAIDVVDLARAPTTKPGDERLHRVGTALEQLPQGQQLVVLNHVLRGNRAGVEAVLLVEGVLAMREQQTAQPGGAHAAAPARAAGGTENHAPAPISMTMAGMAPLPPGMPEIPAHVPHPIEPGPWEPPGNEPGGLYVGNDAHTKIAASYVAAHAGENVLANHFPISGVLGRLRKAGHAPSVDAVSETEAGLKPDIVNLDRLHLYEIKPANAQALGARKATLEIGIFGAAGIAMKLGPVGEPGTTGGAPAPDGVFMFWAPEPGVIVYAYRKGRLVPVPVPVPGAEPTKEPRRRFVLEPLTPQQRQMAATLTVDTALLLVAMILLSSVGI